MGKRYSRGRRKIALKSSFVCPTLITSEVTGVMAKKTYETQADAWNGMQPYSGKLEPYKCRHCHKWHLSTKKRR